MNPYDSLPQDAFWSPAVAKKHMLDISGLWKAPFPISPKAKIATYGSCFAQHFSRALVARGYTWLDTEPAPSGVTDETARLFNYGIFSSRTGNIYTTSLLRQWVEWAVAESAPPAVHWVAEGRIFDPFRPGIEPDGFGSVDEMIRSRETCIASFRDSIMRCNLLVFTLGLTESWWDAKGGFEYPMCPGTHAGIFDPDQHVFRNQDYDFIRENLLKAILLIRRAREKGPRVLLTVSPVPLTATNSGNHVLVATMESKSILRAVAGNVAASVKGVSYFPSYEIISSPVFRGMFFEPNLRSVNSHGVGHVMNCFFAGVDRNHTDSPEASAAKRQSRRHDRQPPSADDLQCDEELLEVFGSRK